MRTPWLSNSRAAHVRNAALALAALAFLGLVAGCGGTQLTEHWRDPAWNQAPLHNVLVVVVRKEAGRRRIWEDALVAALRQRGIAATPSYRTFPDEVPNEDAIDEIMQKTAYDGIVMTRRLTSQEYVHYVPPTVINYRTGHRWGGFYGRYHSYWGTAYSPGYVENEVVVRNEVTVWDARDDGRMIWSGTASTSNPRSVDDLSASLAKTVVKNLVQDGIVP